MVNRFAVGDSNLRPRVVVLSCSDDPAGQQISILNSAFAAKKMVIIPLERSAYLPLSLTFDSVKGVTIDVCLLRRNEVDTNSFLLQQVAFVTGSLYVRPQKLDQMGTHMNVQTSSASVCSLHLTCPSRRSFCVTLFRGSTYQCQRCPKQTCARCAFATKRKYPWGLCALLAYPVHSLLSRIFPSWR